MQCPNCQKKLEERHYRDASFLRCPECQRAHIHLNELRKILSTEQLHRFHALPGDNEAAEIPCFHCGSETVRVSYNQDPAVIFHECLRCDGLRMETIEMLGVIQDKDDKYFQRQVAEKTADELHETFSNRHFLNDLKDLGMELNRPRYAGSMAFVLPLWVERTYSGYPYATLFLIVINALVFQWINPSHTAMETFNHFMLRPDRIRHFQDLSGLLLSNFVHASWVHLLGNLYFLWLFSVAVEERLGSRKFLLSYLALGVFSGLLYSIFTANPQIPVLGASGAISGVMGMLTGLFPRRTITTFFGGRVVEIPVIIFLGVWFAFQLLYFWIGFHGVAWLGHLFGFGCGIGLGVWFRKNAPTASEKQRGEVR